MASWHPVDVSQFDRDDIEDLHDEWDDDFKSNLDLRYNKLRGFDRALNESTDEDNIEMTDKAKDKFKHGTIELVANRIYDRLTILLNPISTGLFCLVVALGGGCFPPPFHNSFVFKVRLLKFCTEILSDRMNNLR